MTFVTDKDRIEATASPAVLELAGLYAEKLAELGHHDICGRRALLLTLAQIAEDHLQ